MKKIHLICNAHLDPIWQWTEDEGIFSALSTFRSAARLCRKYAYIFCHNEAFLYERIRQYDPALFREIQALVKEGKWHIMGGWYLQPDCNMPSGESFLRQILTGKQFFEEHFGCFPTTAINFDPFGHTKGLVQILSKCGQDSYMFTRPEEERYHLDSAAFRWEGFAGTHVKAFRANGYNSPLGGACESVRQRVSMQPDDEILCVLWGVGNHGGGPSEKDLRDLAELQKNSTDECRHSTPEAFFAQIEPAYTRRNSLRISMPGCYTSMSRLKHKHIELENTLYTTEMICSLAAGKQRMIYPSKAIAGTVKDLLASEFHDVLPGTCIKAGEDNGLQRIEHALSALTDLRAHAFFALSEEFPTAQEGTYPILVFNPQPYPRKTTVCAELSLADQNWKEDCVSHITITDQNGATVPSQQIKEESTLNLDWRKKILFEAELQPLSLTLFQANAVFAPPEKAAKSINFSYQDAEKSITVDPETGLLSSFCVQGKEYLAGGILPFLFEDNADPWGMGSFQQKAMGANGEPFALIDRPDGLFKHMNPIQVIEDGDLCKTVEAFFEKGNSRIRMEYTMYKHTPMVDLHMDVFFSDSDCMLKLKIPTAIKGRYIGQTAFGAEPLFEDGRECVSQRFVGIQCGDDGLAILNNCQYGSSFQNNTVFLSLLRGVAYCAHPIADRPLLPSHRFIKRVDQGWLPYDFRLIPAPVADWARLAQEFNRPPYALNVFPSGCAKPTPFPVEISNPRVLLETFKQAEKGDGMVLHLFNSDPDNAEAVLQIEDCKMRLAFCGYEIKNILYRDHKIIETETMCI